MKNYYVLLLWANTNPILYGPYESTSERDNKALEIYDNDNEGSGIYKANVINGDLEIWPYPVDFFENRESLTRAQYIEMAPKFDYVSFVTKCLMDNCDRVETIVMRAGTVKKLSERLKLLAYYIKGDIKGTDMFIFSLSNGMVFDAMTYAQPLDMKYIWVYLLFMIKYVPQNMLKP